MTTNTPAEALIEAMQRCEKAYERLIRYGRPGEVRDHDSARAEFVRLVTAMEIDYGRTAVKEFAWEQELRNCVLEYGNIFSRAESSDTLKLAAFKDVMDHARRRITGE